VIVDVRAVRKSVQKPAARKVPDIKASASVPHPVLGESWKERAVGVRHDLVPLILIEGLMRVNFCVACGHRGDLNHHHLVPRPFQPMAF
jgi:hypothetical protein